MSARHDGDSVRLLATAATLPGLGPGAQVLGSGPACRPGLGPTAGLSPHSRPPAGGGERPLVPGRPGWGPPLVTAGSEAGNTLPSRRGAHKPAWRGAGPGGSSPVPRPHSRFRPECSWGAAAGPRPGLCPPAAGAPRGVLATVRAGAGAQPHSGPGAQQTHSQGPPGTGSPTPRTPGHCFKALPRGQDDPSRGPPGPQPARALPGPRIQSSCSMVALVGPRLAAHCPGAGARTACGGHPPLGPRLRISVPGSRDTARPQPRAGQWRAGGDWSAPAGTGGTARSRVPTPGLWTVLARGCQDSGRTAGGRSSVPCPRPLPLLHGKNVFHATGSQCQKGWGPLV